MKTSSFLLSLLAGVLVAGSATAEPTRTVDWYRKHPTDRAARLTECRNNPGELGDTPHCINAERAESLETFSKRGGAPKLKPMTADEIYQRLDTLQRGE